MTRLSPVQRDARKRRVVDALSSMGLDGLLRRLGVDVSRAQRSRNTLRIPCPVHGGNDPNCSVSLKEGAIVWHCFSRDCQSEFGADALGLIAGVNGLSTRRNFEQVLKLGAAIAHVDIEYVEHVADVVPIRRAKPVAPPPPSYPPIDEVQAVWDSALLVGDEAGAAAYLEGRGLNPAQLEDRDLCRVIAEDSALPSWARFKGRSWAAGGHRIVTPMVDACGDVRSLRAWTWGDDKPKRVAPAGFSCKGLVFAEGLARQVLKLRAVPGWWRRGVALRIVITEGEPDFLTWSSRASDCDPYAPAILGVVSGSWSLDIANRIPSDATVIIRTHQDEAGERYAEKIYETLAGRVADVRRGT